MYKDPDEHRESILERFSKDFRTKYDIGQSEHGGNLFNKNVQAMAKDEALDFVSYLYTLIDQVTVATEILADIEIQDPDIYARAKQAYRLLKFGNINGTLEEDR